MNCKSIQSCAHEDVLASYADELCHNDYKELEQRIENEELDSEELEAIIISEYI